MAAFDEAIAEADPRKLAQCRVLLGRLADALVLEATPVLDAQLKAHYRLQGTVQ